MKIIRLLPLVLLAGCSTAIPRNVEYTELPSYGKPKTEKAFSYAPSKNDPKDINDDLFRSMP